MKRFKDTLVAKGSALYEALEKSGPEAKKAAEKIYAKTNSEYKARYSEEDRAWFAMKSRESKPEQQPEKIEVLNDIGK